MKLTISETHDIKLTVDQIYQAIRELTKSERTRLVEMIVDPQAPVKEDPVKERLRKWLPQFYSGISGLLSGEILTTDDDGQIHKWPNRADLEADTFWRAGENVHPTFVGTDAAPAAGGDVTRNGVTLHWKDTLYQVPDAYSIPAN